MCSQFQSQAGRTLEVAIGHPRARGEPPAAVGGDLTAHQGVGICQGIGRSGRGALPSAEEGGDGGWHSI